jgi:hypothetical protein
MITMKQWMELVDYKITEGSDYFPNFVNAEDTKGTLYMLSSWNGDHDGWSFSIAFDPQDNQKVYLVEACDYRNNRAYRMKDAALDRDSDKQAWDDCEFTELEVDSDFIEKSLAIKRGEVYDTRVQVPLDLDEKTMFKLMKMAHESDITLNQQVEKILRKMIEHNEPVVKNNQSNQ